MVGLPFLFGPLRRDTLDLSSDIVVPGIAVLTARAKRANLSYAVSIRAARNPSGNQGSLGMVVGWTLPEHMFQKGASWKALKLRTDSAGSAHWNEMTGRTLAAAWPVCR